MSQQGETDGYSVEDHIRAIEKHSFEKVAICTKYSFEKV